MDTQKDPEMYDYTPSSLVFDPRYNVSILSFAVAIGYIQKSDLANTS